ncbi:hypothetical protein V2J09_019411 [Rumex salicifolius]
MPDLRRQHSVVIKLLGRPIAFQVLEREIREMWNPSGKIVITDLPNGFYIVQFKQEPDFFMALTAGPWTTGGGGAAMPTTAAPPPTVVGGRQRRPPPRTAPDRPTLPATSVHNSFAALGECLEEDISSELQKEVGVVSSEIEHKNGNTSRDKTTREQKSRAEGKTKEKSKGHSPTRIEPSQNSQETTKNETRTKDGKEDGDLTAEKTKVKTNGGITQMKPSPNMEVRPTFPKKYPSNVKRVKTQGNSVVSQERPSGLVNNGPIILATRPICLSYSTIVVQNPEGGSIHPDQEVNVVTIPLDRQWSRAETVGGTQYKEEGALATTEYEDIDMKLEEESIKVEEMDEDMGNSRHMEASPTAWRGGDYNCILFLDERQGGAEILSPDSNRFANWINQLQLIDMGGVGSRFTWRRGISENTKIHKRLDRVLVNLIGRLRWDEASVKHLPANNSDHNPLYLTLTNRSTMNPACKPFRFEAAWILHPEFLKFVGDNWNTQTDVFMALDHLRRQLIKWNRDVFGNSHHMKSELVARISGIQCALESRNHQGLITLESRLQCDLENTLAQEEALWFQKSRENWIEMGDRNNKFFHNSTIIRRRRNRISALRIDDEKWQTDPEQLEDMAVNFFTDLYTLPIQEAQNHILPRGGFPPLTDEILAQLSHVLEREEIWKAVSKMGAYKAPEADEFQPVLFKTCWSTMGNSVFDFVQQLFSERKLQDGVNDTIITLVGKVAKPKVISQYRPISLCKRHLQDHHQDFSQ